jgi:hypothetical protein
VDDGRGCGASKDGLEWSVLGDVASNAAGIGQTDEEIDVVVESDGAASGGQSVSRAQLRGVVDGVSSHLVVDLLIVEDVLSLGDALGELDAGVNRVLAY